MTTELVSTISGEMFKTVLYVAGPPLLIGLVVGLLVGLFQTVTQVQEFTLTFVPKMLAVFALLFFMMPWLTGKLVEFTTNLITNIPIYVK
jgi:flagellar biosynthetic protein FliQ